MQLLSTHHAVEALGQASAATIGPHAGLDAVRAMLAHDLAYVDHALGHAVREGERPATDAAAHLVAAGGKRVRPMALLLSAACFGPVSAAARELSVAVEMVHAATLLHDDVIDDGDERRGRPTARKVYGNAVSVLAGDLMLTHALDRTARALPEALPDLLVTLRRLVDGEVVQLRARASFDLSAATYERVLIGKTASLFGWATGAGARAGGAGDAEIARMAQFGERVGVAFQLVDDALDYEGDPALTGKTVLGDLREGKATLPLALTLAAEPGLLSDAQRAREGDLEAAARVAGRVVAGGACAEVRRRAATETERARGCLATLGRCPARDLLESVVGALTLRAH